MTYTSKQALATAQIEMKPLEGQTRPLALSLFSGAMGLDLGMEQAGFKTICCVEKDKHACATIRKNTAIPVIENDITKVSVEEIEAAAGVAHDQISLVYGGPPCQAFSTAGRQRSLQDFRGNLVLQFLRIVAEVQPEYFVFENVRGILYAKLEAVPDGPDYSRYAEIVSYPGSVVRMLVSEFQKLGYTISFSLFNSAKYGVPQSRDRFIMFGTKRPDEVMIPAPTHGDRPGQQPLLTLRDALADLPAEADAGGLRFTPKHERFLSMLQPGQYWTALPAEMQEEALGKAYHLTGGRTGFFRRLDWDKPSPTLVTSPVMPATMLCHPDELRPLSVREYARIQQFPDQWQFEGPRVQIYKQIGNAVPVGLGEVAGRAVLAHMEQTEIVQRQRPEVPSTSRYKGTNHREFLNVFKETPARTYQVAEEAPASAPERQLDLFAGVF